MSPKEAKVCDWQHLVKQATEYPQWRKPLIRSPQGTTLFTRLGEFKKGASKPLLLSVRLRGMGIGTVFVDPDSHSREFKAARPEKENGRLYGLLKRAGFDPAQARAGVFSGVPWNSEDRRDYVKRLWLCADADGSDDKLEKAIEEDVVRALKGSKHEGAFQGLRIRLVEKNMGQKLPFGFAVPIRIDQETKASVPAPGWISNSSGYGYIDVLATVDAALGDGSERVAVLELKKPRGKAKVALLQGYAYAVAIHAAARSRIGRDLLDLLSLKKKPANLKLAAYAMVPLSDVKVVQSSPLTKAVLREIDDDFLAGIIGYEYDKNGVLKIREIWHGNSDNWRPVPVGNCSPRLTC